MEGKGSPLNNICLKFIESSFKKSCFNEVSNISFHMSEIKNEYLDKAATQNTRDSIANTEDKKF